MKVHYIGLIIIIIITYVCPFSREITAIYFITTWTVFIFDFPSMNILNAILNILNGILNILSAILNTTAFKYTVV